MNHNSGEHGQPEDGQGPGVTDDASSDSEVEPMPVGFSQLLKHYGPSSVKGSAGKVPEQTPKQKTRPAKAKANPAKPVVAAVPTPAAAKAPTVPVLPQAAGPQAAEPLKVDIGQTKKSRRGIKQKAQTNDGEMDFGLGLGGDIGLDGDGLSEADRNTIDHYDAKLKTYKEIKPPLADGPFKGYLTDLSQKITAVSNEVKTKKRSAVRRNGKEEDPLYIALSNTHEKLSNLQQLIKCALVFVVGFRDGNRATVTFPL